ncbi:MAG: cysteine desulfurase [Candidatus Nanohaloarchaea archaeon]|nr:cysteine desulfurase [Candidatus Nanohaloarchaea archaeon]
MALKPYKYIEDFSALEEKVNGERIAYLDNAATTHKPNQVIEALKDFYTRHNANPGKSLHELANRAKRKLDQSRETVADFINASPEEAVFTRNCTESINLVSQSLEIEGKIIIPEMSHHSNQLPWRKKAERRGLEIEYIPTKENQLDIEAAKDLIDSNTGIVSASHISNVFGCRNPVKTLADLAHDNNALILVDGAQSVPRLPTDVRDIDADFLAFSSHKMCGPTGTGVLYGKKNLLEELESYQVGGGMVRTVEKSNIEFEPGPERFEAGTENVAGAVGLAEAVKYLEEIGLDKIYRHEKQLSKRIIQGLEDLDNVKIYAPDNACLVSFHIEDIHPHDVSEILNSRGIAIRSGHHCAQLQMEKLGITGTSRASPYLYNTEKDIDRFLEAVQEAQEVFER